MAVPIKLCNVIVGRDDDGNFSSCEKHAEKLDTSWFKRVFCAAEPNGQNSFNEFTIFNSIRRDLAEKIPDSLVDPEICQLLSIGRVGRVSIIKSISFKGLHVILERLHFQRTARMYLDRVGTSRSD